MSLLKVPLPGPVELRLPVRKAGCVDAIAVWFDLHLSTSCSLSTSPSSRTRWEKAIFPVEKGLPGEELSVEVSCSESQTGKTLNHCFVEVHSHYRFVYCVELI